MENVPANLELSPEDMEDLSEFKFQKFAATYFIGNVNHVYSRRTLRSSLLPLKSTADQLAAQALWITILRFMGDLPEPRYTLDMPRDNTPVMNKVIGTLSRSFAKSKEFQQMGFDTAVRIKFIIYISFRQKLLFYEILNSQRISLGVAS